MDKRQRGVIFEFAELNDFLLAGFKRPLLLAAIVSALVIAPWISHLIRRRLFVGKTFLVILVVSAMIMPHYTWFVWTMSDLDPQESGQSRLAKVYLKTNEPKMPIGLGFIGTTEKFLFFHAIRNVDTTEKELDISEKPDVFVIPVANVAAVRILQYIVPPWDKELVPNPLYEPPEGDLLNEEISTDKATE